MSPKKLFVALTGVAGLTGAGVMWVSVAPLSVIETPSAAATTLPASSVPAVASPSPSGIPSAPAAKTVGSDAAGVGSEVEQPEAEVEVELPEYAKNNTDYPTLAMRMEEIQARRNGTTYDPQAVLAAMQQPSAWKPDEDIADQLPLDAEEKADGREFIRFNPLKVESLVPGDTMEIPIWQTSANYEMVVDRVEAHGDGNVTWYGHLKGFEEDNQVSITRGETLTYGGITTPEGLFVLEARTDIGWIANSGTLHKGEDLHVEVSDTGNTAQPSHHGTPSHGSTEEQNEPEVM